MRVEHEYNRHSALAWPAGPVYDVHHVRSAAWSRPTGIAPMGRLAEQVMTAQPYASGNNQVFWAVEGGSSPSARCPPSTTSCDLDVLAKRVLALQGRYNAITRPFHWRFTHTDLNQLLDRLATPETANTPPLAA